MDIQHFVKKKHVLKVNVSYEEFDLTLGYHFLFWELFSALNKCVKLPIKVSNVVLETDLE